MPTMSSTPSITFVIGAGASKEVDMPTGDELKQLIAKSLGFEHRDGGIYGGNDQIREALYQLGHRSAGISTFRHYLRIADLIKSAMPLAPSIDNFIDSHRDDPKVAELGKLAIASSILAAERNSLLFVDQQNLQNKLNFKAVASKWFTTLFQLLTLNTQAKDLSSRLRKVSIVSFNYDRTLEHFLHWSLRNYYALSEETASELLGDLRVFHPYGTVGQLPWQQQIKAVPFGASLATDELIKVSTGLRTFTEGTDTSSSQIDQIRSVVFDTDRLVFLGFAYHELNLDLLFGKGRSQTSMKHTKQIYGSAYGLSESNKKAITWELSQLGRCDLSQVTLRRELTATELLPEYSRSLKI